MASAGLLPSHHAESFPHTADAAVESGTTSVLQLQQKKFSSGVFTTAFHRDSGIKGVKGGNTAGRKDLYSASGKEWSHT
jgi:hypothetical protein